MNIKIAKAFRTLSYEASCVLAGVCPIRIVIEEKVRTYKATHNNIKYDAPLRYWPHPPEIPLIRAPTEIPHNVINIFIDIGEIVYDKIPRETVITEGKENGLTKWQEQWTSSTKGAVSKLFFPNIKVRMKTTIPILAEFMAIVTGHGLNRSYHHRFKFIPNSTCPCRIKEEQTINHIIMNCTQLESERRIL